MPIAIVVGAQYGSEGKGKVCADLAKREQPRAAVRCGGPNSGHTIWIGDCQVVLRQLPAAALVSSCRLLLPAGAIVSPGLLLSEISRIGIDPRRVGVDYRASILEPRHVAAEEGGDLGPRIGSTLSGTGEVVAERVARRPELRLAASVEQLKPYIVNVAEEVATIHEAGDLVHVEGTQGYGLSVLHSPYYPFATSRDVTASGFASEVGIAPGDVERVVLVARCDPIRVAGNSGPLPGERTWDEVTEEAGAPASLMERTSVTCNIRRVGAFDDSLFRAAVKANCPDLVVLNHLDHVSWAARGARKWTALPWKAQTFVEEVERIIHVDRVGVGPDVDDLLDCPALR
jgi:adenylosuccinate synthase